MKVTIAPSLRFPEAARLWLDSRRPKLAPKTVLDCEYYIRNLGKRFAGRTLSTITIEDFEQYQVERQKTAGASCINHELNVLSRILKRAGLWAALEDFYEPLPVPDSEVGIALSSEEEAHLLEVAKRKPRWKVVYYCSLISAATTAGPGELRHLRLKDVDLEKQEIHITVGIKNKFRRRTVPLNDGALWAATELVERARKLGCSEPQHHLLPFRPKQAGAGYDPTRPMEGWRSGWRSLRKEAAKMYSRLLAMRFNDWRHTACTRMLEDPNTSERTVEEMMGHRLASRIKERYSHIRQEAKRGAVAVLNAPSEQHKQPQRVSMMSASGTLGLAVWLK